MGVLQFETHRLVAFGSRILIFQRIAASYPELLDVRIKIEALSRNAILGIKVFFFLLTSP